MYKYGIINNKLRMLDLTSEHMNPTTVYKDMPKPCVPIIRSRCDTNSYIVNIDVMPTVSPVNASSLSLLKTAITDGKYTDIESVYPRMRIKLDYIITDSNGNTVEEGSKVRICNINSSYRILPITTENMQEYSDVIECYDTFDIGVNVTTLGISKNFTSNAYNIKIANIELSVAISDKTISDSYMTSYQSQIGWSPASRTQDELGEYYYTIYSEKDNNDAWDPIEISNLPKLMKCLVRVNAAVDLFANVENCAEIEDLVIENQRGKLLYEISTSVDGTAIDPIKDIKYMSHSIVETSAPRKVASVKINDALYTFEEGDYDDSQTSILHKTIDDYVFTITVNENSYDVSIYFESVITNYTVEISTVPATE